MSQRDVVTFVPKPSMAAERNVAAFVELCKQRLTVFGADLPFGSAVWDVTSQTRRRGSSARDRIYFVRNGEGRRLSEEPMAAPFVDFAKAYIRYMQGMRPARNVGLRVTALRSLEFVVAERMSAPAVHLVTCEDLDQAVSRLRERLGDSAAYRTCATLENVAAFLDDNFMVPVPLQWRSSAPRPPEGPRTGPVFRMRKFERLPSRAALEALPVAFNRATAPSDRLIASYAALMFATHPRGCEVSTLPANAEVISIDEDGSRGHALRWWPAKGNRPMLKWLVPGMEEVAARALKQIVEITAEARKMAAWYERNPTSVYLPPDLAHLRRQQFVSRGHADAILGGARAYGALRGKAQHKGFKGANFYAFRDVEKYAVSHLPDDFPVFDQTVGISFSEALFVIPRGFLQGGGVSPMPCVFERVSSQHLRAGLGCRKNSGASVFDHLGLTEEDGSPIRLKPHAIRHYLTDLSLRNGLSEIDTAAWAGRAPKQNIHYNHMSDEEQLVHVRKLLRKSSPWASSNEAIIRHEPVPRSDFSTLMAPTAHSTDLGFCVRDIATLPCEMHRDCLFCTEQICIKGDERRTATAKRWLADNQALLVRARKAMSEEAFGADRWVEHTQRAVEQLTCLLALLEDPRIPDGSVVRLAVGVMPSRIREAMQERAVLEEGRGAKPGLTGRPNGQKSEEDHDG